MTLPPDRSSSPGSAEETLRLVATLPAPHGLADRIQSGLHYAPRNARILFWPEALGPRGSFARGAAAAAIVCVVAGGGWRIYSRVPAQASPQVIQMPHRYAPGGFGAANARHVPQTLDGPVLIQHAPVPLQAEPVKALNIPPAPAIPLKPKKKFAHPVAAAPVH